MSTDFRITDALITVPGDLSIPPFTKNTSARITSAHPEQAYTIRNKRAFDCFRSIKNSWTTNGRRKNAIINPSAIRSSRRGYAARTSMQARSPGISIRNDNTPPVLFAVEITADVPAPSEGFLSPISIPLN